MHRGVHFSESAHERAGRREQVSTSPNVPVDWIGFDREPGLTVARGIWAAEVTSNHRSDGFGSSSLLVNAAFSAVFQEFVSSRMRERGMPNF